MPVVRQQQRTCKSRAGRITDRVEVRSGDPRAQRRLPASNNLLLSETIRLVQGGAGGLAAGLG